MIDDLKAAVGWELAENVLDGVMLSAPDGRVFAANPAACALLGRTEADIVGSGRAGLVVVDANLEEALEERRLTGAVSSDLRMVRGDGSIILAEVASQMFDGPDGETLTLITFRDVTERRRLERELAESELRFRALAEATFEAVAVHVDGLLVDANEPFFELFGYGTDAIGTLRVRDLIEPSSRLAADAFIADRGEGPVELQLRRSGGEVFHGEVRARNVTLGGVAARVVSIRDMEERRRAEAERAESAARAAELARVRSLAALAGGIAHEFNNTIQAVLGATELAQDPASTAADVARLLGEIKLALDRAATLSAAMLAYSGHQNVVRRHVDLAGLAAGVVGRSREREATEVEAPEHPLVLVDEHAITGILAVLLENAAEATVAPAGRIGVRVGTVLLGSEDAASAYPAGEVEPGEYAFVEVSDGGEGMDAATRARMFDPFFTTRFPGRGLGLAAALGVARAHRGGFLVRSEPGRGTCVRLLVPLGAGSEPAPQP